ncbi:MAG: phosphoribosylanthranilate isomerase, partial [Actinomycetota bacterium]
MFVKICGVTSAEDALLAAGLGANAVGMIFAASSRRIATGEARDIVRRLPPEILPVGVFRDERPARRPIELAIS